MTTLLHISDPHFGTERAEVVEALERLAAELRPDVLLLTGDITQRATAAQFKAARAFVDRLGVPVCLAIPGNHDIPLFNLGLRLFKPYARFAEAFGAALEPEFESDDVLVIAVKTTRRWRHENGEVSRAQVARVVRRLAAAKPEALRLVLVHQPVAVTEAEDNHNLLRGHQHAVKSWAAAGADIVLGGHIHLPFVLPLEDASRRLWAVQAGTAVSSRVRRGADNSVNVIRTLTGMGARVCMVERWDHQSATQRFERVERQALALQPLSAAAHGTG